MKNIYLCGHTGSQNRGCEAIVRSTVYILETIGIEKKNRFLLTYNKFADELFGVDKIINLIPYQKSNVLDKGIAYLYRRLKDNNLKYTKKRFKKILDMPADESILFSIGGDLYCYGTPYTAMAFNEYAKDRGIPNVFYGCSINEDTPDKKDMCRDINSFSYIVTREPSSEETFKKVLDDKSKLYHACDPAFQLPVTETELPEGFLSENTVGINISPLVFSDVNDVNDIMYKNIFSLIDYITENTDMNVCLIPHVYNIENNTQDIFVLNNIYNNCKDNRRVSIVNKELSCTELKYIISKCRFFIGARTHATIAAYSTGVPTLVLSYSVKSRGIARDLFGKEEGYLLKWRDISGENDIKDVFVSSLLKNEDEIRRVYSDVLPGYKQSIIDATRKVLESLNYKDEKQK